MHRQSIPIKVVCFAALTSVTGLANAGGYALIEHGASGLGNAYAGNAAVAADASTLYFNPAGMVHLADRQLLVGAHFISVDTSITDQGTTLNNALGGTPVSGNSVGSNDSITTVPNIYFVSPLGDKFAYGISLDVPFGSSSDYGDQWFGRYSATESSLTIVEINPSIAYRVSDQFQVGFGLNVQSATATLENSVDSGAVCFAFAASDPGAEANCVNAGLTPGNLENDSQAGIDGDSTALGFNIGFMFTPTENTRLGVSYRHSVDHTLEGTGTFDNSEPFQALIDASGSELFRTGGGETEITTPAIAALSVAHRLGNFDRLQLLADATWTQWSEFDELRIEFDGPQPDALQVQDWRNAWRVSAGLNYQYSQKLTLRAGVAFDESPIPGPTRRAPRIPGNDRTWFSLGFGYQQSESISFDVGFTHIELDETPIDNDFPESGPSALNLRSLVDSDVNILSAQLNWKF